MEYIQQLLANRILMAGLVSWASAQVIKAILYLIMNGRFDIERLFGDGGMPSGHSATVSAAALTTGMECGFASPVFAVMLLVAMGSVQTAGIGNMLLNLGIVAFCIVVLFHTVTLPVEFNASSRAIKQLESLGIIEGDEIRGAKKVLSAAAMTYVAALAVSVMNLIRILLIRGRQ